MLPSTEPVEAVIISGPRRSEIVRLPDEGLSEHAREEVQKFNEALDQLIAAIDRVSAEVRATTGALRQMSGDTCPRGADGSVVAR